jgi:hypothetical protein
MAESDQHGSPDRVIEAQRFVTARYGCRATGGYGRSAPGNGRTRTPSPWTAGRPSSGSAAMARISSKTSSCPPTAPQTRQPVPAPPLAVQPVSQLGHHLPVPTVRPRNSHKARTKCTISRAGNNITAEPVAVGRASTGLVTCERLHPP